MILPESVFAGFAFGGFHKVNKNLFLVGLFVFFSGVLLAQPVVIKPTVGVNFSHLGRHQFEDDYTTKTGFQAGASASIGNKFYVEPGLFYVNKNTGYQITQRDFDGPELKGTYHLSGMQIPLSVGYRIAGGKKSAHFWGLRPFAGGSAFFLNSTDQTLGLNKTQWGLFAGLGFDISCFFLDAKYEWTLTDEQKKVLGADLGRSKSLYVNAGIHIPVRKPGKG